MHHLKLHKLGDLRPQHLPHKLIKQTGIIEDTYVHPWRPFTIKLL